MSFFEKARTGYEHLAGRADRALDSVTARGDLGDVDQHYRDLGLLAYLAATGRAGDPTEQERVVATLAAMEQRGAIRDFVLTTGDGAALGETPAPQRPGGADGIPQPPPERAGRHGDFLTHTPAAHPGWAASDPDETTGPRPDGHTPPPPAPPSIGGTWGPPPPPPR